MVYQNAEVSKAAKLLKAKLKKLDNKRAILRQPEMTALFDRLKMLPAGKARAGFGREVNALRQELESLIAEKSKPKAKKLPPIDVTAPFDTNVPPDQRPGLLPASQGSRHPLMTELEKILDIFYRMGFTAVESRELDDDYHMFTSLNFPPGHPARDEWDTFVTDEGLIAPAHTSTMQNRVLKTYKPGLENGQPIAVVIPGRTFRNEDVDASHEHTLHQLEGVYVGENINAGHLMATLKTFLEEYYGQAIEIKTQPFYFPFTEPSFEVAMSCPFCGQQGCAICKHGGWIELLGCGMIHPNVLREAGIEPAKYSGFAWGMGTMRLVMMKHGIEDIRHFNSGNLKFLRQFS